MSLHAERELTKNQALVFRTLNAADGPLSAYAILDKLRDDGFRAPLQVYRALDKLIGFGMVHRLESMNAFVACAHQHCGDHDMAAFAICEKCNYVEEFLPAEAMESLRAWSAAENFTPSRTTIELRGVCSKCKAS